MRWHPTPVLLPGKSHGRRSLVGCSPWGRWGSDTTERLYFHFSLSCIGEGNGNPLQCSCLENPRFRGAWWAAVYGVAQSRTWLKWLSSSSSSSSNPINEWITRPILFWLIQRKRHHEPLCFYHDEMIRESILWGKNNHCLLWKRKEINLPIYAFWFFCLEPKRPPTNLSKTSGELLGLLTVCTRG